MNRLGMIVALQFLGGVAICQSVGKLEPLPKRGIPAISKQPLAMYWLSKTDGSVWRASLDGTRKELVVDTKVKGLSAVGVAGARPGKGSYLVLSSVPYRGYTILDIPPRNVPGKSLDAILHRARTISKFEPVPLTFSDRRSDWQAKVTMRGFFIGDHTHNDMGQIQLKSKATAPRSYTFTAPGGGILALLEGGAVVLKDADKVILWTLANDRKYLFAEVRSCKIWTRDLSKPERHTPVAKVVTKKAAYTYKLKSPQDIKRPVSAMVKTSERNTKGQSHFVTSDGKVHRGK